MRMKEDNYYGMLPKNSSMYLRLLYMQKTGCSHQDCLRYIKGTSPVQIHFDSRFFLMFVFPDHQQHVLHKRSTPLEAKQW